MRKTRLSPDTLRVETFDVDPRARAPQGTVHAHAITQLTSFCQCDATHYGTCQGTCVNTCGGPTCSPPCRSTMTFYVTCQATCSWTDGMQVCYGPLTTDC